MKNSTAYGIILILLIAAGSSLSSCSLNSAKPENEPLIAEVEILEISSQEIKNTLNGFGNLSFKRKADIRAAVNGIVKNIAVDAGDKVIEGQIIAQLYNLQLRIREQQARAALFSAESAYELSSVSYIEGRQKVEAGMLNIEKLLIRQTQKQHELDHLRQQHDKKKQLFSIGGTTEEELNEFKLSLSGIETEIAILDKDIQINQIGFRDADIRAHGFDVPENPEVRKKLIIDLNSLKLKAEKKVSEAAVISAETELRSAEALLKETDITSPISGIIGVRHLECGERVSTDSITFTVFDSSEVDLIFSVPEEVGISLYREQEVELTLDAISGRSFTARIRQISPAVDTKSGNISVRAGMSNTEGLFIPGMFSRFSLTYGDPQRTILIPAECVLKQEGADALVMQLTEDRVYPVSIKTIMHDNGYFEVTGGLEDGDRIIISPSPLLKEGEYVHVKASS